MLLAWLLEYNLLYIKTLFILIISPHVYNLYGKNIARFNCFYRRLLLKSLSYEDARPRS